MASPSDNCGNVTFLLSAIETTVVMGTANGWGLLGCCTTGTGSVEAVVCAGWLEAGSSETAEEAQSPNLGLFLFNCAVSPLRFVFCGLEGFVEGKLQKYNKQLFYQFYQVISV